MEYIAPCSFFLYTPSMPNTPRGSASGDPEAPLVSDALERLRAGAIDLEEYLDIQVEEAVGHLARLLPRDKLEQVREVVRNQLRQDPALVEFIRKLAAQNSRRLPR